MAIFKDNGRLEKCGTCAGAGTVESGPCSVCDGTGVERVGVIRWRLEIDNSVRESIERHCEWDITEMDALRTMWSPDRMDVVFDAVWECCRHQAEVLGVDEEDFARRLGGGADERAWSAMHEELDRFFTARGLAAHATVLGETLKLVRESMAKASAAISEKAASIGAGMDARIREEMDRVLEEMGTQTDTDGRGG